jgi:hypothetical protein
VEVGGLKIQASCTEDWGPHSIFKASQDLHSKNLSKQKEGTKNKNAFLGIKNIMV